MKELLKKAAKILKIKPEILEILSTPERVFTVNFPVKMDDGGFEIFEGYRVQHNSALGPYKGGIRYHSEADLEEIKTLAFLMMIKCAVAGLPLGGGKGGVKVDPKTLSEGELKRLSQAYVKAISDVIGAYKDVPAPDVNTNSKIMAWMVDEYRRLRIEAEPSFVQPAPRVSSAQGPGHSTWSSPKGGVRGALEKGDTHLLKRNLNFENEILATFTGKPLEMGGSEGREEATGRGGVYVLQAALQKTENGRQKTDSGKTEKTDKTENLSSVKSVQSAIRHPSSVYRPLTVAVQGFGNVGFNVARFLFEAGFKIVGLSDSQGGIYFEEGFDPNKTMACKRKKGKIAECYCAGSVVNGKCGLRISNEALLQLPVDILVPAALENVITAQNAEKIKARIVLEMANGPITPEADEILAERGILVVPDILANAGGVTVSYFEWKQNLSNEHWTKDQVNKRLKEKMVRALGDVWDRAEKYKVDLRTAAYILALERIAEKYKLL